MPNIRVMHFGLGPIGAAIVKQVASRPGFKIVGAIDIDPAKVGRDLGDVVGLSKRLGIKVSSDNVRAQQRRRCAGYPLAVLLPARGTKSTPAVALVIGLAAGLTAELLQYLHLADLLGLKQGSLPYIVLGNTFSFVRPADV